MRIALITDAWHPQVNGIVTTLASLAKALEGLGHAVEIFGPDRFRTWPCPGYPDVGLSFLCGPRLRPLLEAFRPDAIHIATEGPVGYAARRYCRHRGLAYTSSFHSFFDEYLKLRIGFPLWISRTYLRWFHRRSARVLVGCESLAKILQSRGFRRTALWLLGVDTELFKPGDKTWLSLPRPVFLYVGRLAVEKNVEGFLRLDLPGSKLVVGDGPQRAELQARFPGAQYQGYRRGAELARCMAAADVLVFPSRTDTFGLAMLEALACGVPVAALPVPGPLDVVRSGKVGILDEDLKAAALGALALNPDDCRRYALGFSWASSARSFLAQLVPCGLGAARLKA
ncbi:glycosyltransferase family 4 protein [Methyloterricola oryzae]|uniref:glycosyltransferase family 4 protein n=1 Tax=Methyloterricola oryzae TaxID=1495050 RepID=UPI0005EBD79A|nr:glycosyltransferase family 1 protein [Methyloterricola oryzae]